MRKFLITLGFIAAVGSIAQSTKTTKSRETSQTTTSDGISSNSSITRSSETYKFNASFNAEKYDAVKELLVDHLGTRYLEVRGSTYEWIKEKGDRAFFSCKLRGREVNLSLDRGEASADFYELIDELGDDLRDVIQAHKPLSWTTMTPTPPQPPSNPHSTDPQLYKEQVRQAERELARAQRNLERLKKKN